MKKRFNPKKSIIKQKVAYFSLLNLCIKNGHSASFITINKIEGLNLLK